MEIPLRGLSRVKPTSLIYILKNWKSCLSVLEKATIVLLGLFVVLTSWRWVMAAGQYKGTVPRSGGGFVEGVVGLNVDDFDLGRLTKSALVKIDPTGQVVADVAQSWEVSADKLSYKFTINPKYSAYELADILSKNPTYIAGAMPEILDNSTLSFKVEAPDNDFLQTVSKPIFPYGPYKLDKKTKNEIRLKPNKDYHLQAPYIEKFIIRGYPSQAALEKAAKKNKITGASDLSSLPKGWQQSKTVLSKKHMLFINSSKSYLKKTSVREKILAGEKPEGIQTLDLLEVNGNGQDPQYEALKQKLIASGVDLKIRQIGLKDALLQELPKRNYDLLYILVDVGVVSDPYLLWDSSQRSGEGQNFAELANADVDELVSEYAKADDPAKKAAIGTKINELVAKEKVAVEYGNLQFDYAATSKLKGFVVPSTSYCESGRFDFASTWYFYEKRQR